MQNIVNIINELQNTSSTNGKLSILKREKDNELLKKVLYYTYHDGLKYGITEQVINPYIAEFATYDKDIFELFTRLASSNINDELRKEVGIMLGSLPQDVGKLVLNMLQKDLRCGISSKTISKVWKDLLPQFGCMLASKYFDNEKVVKGKEFTLTCKMDGHRCIIVKDNNNVHAFTRQNKEYIGLDEIINEVAKDDGRFVLDGELLVSNYKDIAPDTRYKATSNIVRKDGAKTGVKLIAFDILPLDDFYNGKCDMPYTDRRMWLEDYTYDLEFVEWVEKFYSGNDTSVILPLLDKVVERGEEGLMLNLNNAPYECKRTKNLLKLKKFQTGDMRVVDIIEGDGKNKGLLGAITVEFLDGNEICRCNVGSGFSDSERLLYINKPNLLLNKIVEIKYFEITHNASGGTGLRFPIWIGRIREDKNEISMY